MYCSSCGVVVTHGLTYCNHCGAKLTAEKGDKVIKSSEVKPEALIWGMVAVLVFGFVAIVFLMMAMKMVGLNVGQILAFTMLSFLIMLLLEFVLGSYCVASVALKRPAILSYQRSKRLESLMRHR